MPYYHLSFELDPN